MTCKELVELVTDYLEGALSDEVRAKVEEHLATCQACTNYLEEVRITIRLTGMLTEEQLPPDARRALLLAFRDWRSTST